MNPWHQLLMDEEFVSLYRSFDALAEREERIESFLADPTRTTELPPALLAYLARP